MNFIGSGFLRNIKRLLGTGWADYKDTQFTSAAPFVLLTTEGKVNLPNNAGAVVGMQKPIGIGDMYAGGLLVGRIGDAYTITVEFRVRPTSAATNARISLSIDIGGAIGEIYNRDFVLTKGNGVEHYYLSSFTYYTLDTFQANGGRFKVEASNSNLEIYNVRYVIARIHAAQ